MIKLSRLSDMMRQAIKATTKNLVDLCGGPKEASRHSRVGASTLSLYSAEQEEERFISADDILALELACGEPALTRWLANAQGYELSRTAAPAGGGAVGHADLGRLIAECSGATTALCDALADRGITPTERKRCKREFAELRHALARIEAKLEGR